MKELFGGLLIAVGIILMAASGLCSGLVLAIGFGWAINEPQMLSVPLLYGGVPFLIGFGLYKWGRWLTRDTGGELVYGAPPSDAPSGTANSMDSPLRP